MKKILCIVLTVAFLLGLTACGKSDAKVKTATAEIKDEYSGEFRVGYGKQNITPDYPVALQGFGNVEERQSQGCLDYIYAICIAVSDEKDNTVLLFNLDMPGCKEKVTDGCRQEISKKTGVPFDNVIFNATHTHSAPSLECNFKKSPMNAQYVTDFRNWVVKAAIEAMNDRAPAKMAVGSTEATGLSFVRHYFDVNGLCFGDNHNSISHDTAAKHTSDVDPTMNLIKFDRSATKDKKDVYYINWRCHPHRTGGIREYDISSDIVGIAREEFAKQTNSLAAYFEGAAGNINPTTQLPGEEYPKDYLEHASKLAGFALSICDKLKSVDTGEIKVKTDKVNAEINHTLDNMVAFSKEVQEVFAKTNDPHEAQRLAMTKGLYSVYQCNAICNRASMAKSQNINITSVSIGKSVGLTYAPYEMFDTNSVYIEENSPFDFTCIQGYSNAGLGYIPSSYGYEYGCYEGDTTRFLAGTGEKVADQFVKDLKELKNGK